MTAYVFIAYLGLAATLVASQRQEEVRDWGELFEELKENQQAQQKELVDLRIENQFLRAEFGQHDVPEMSMHGARRELKADAYDFSKYRGVVITQEKSFITMGPKNNDIKLLRDAKGKLQIIAPQGINFVTNSLTYNDGPLASGGGSGGGWTTPTPKPGPGGPPKSCSEVLAGNPKAPDGAYNILYKGVKTTVQCDMSTRGGGWTLVLRDSWKDKTVYCTSGGCPFLTKENNIGSAAGTADYVGPHLMGTQTGTIPLRTTVDLMYTIDGCSTADCKIISHQDISFHSASKNKIESGCYEDLKTAAGNAVYSHNPHHYWRVYPSKGCGISTDRDNGDNCWNNMFASNRWENLPGGNDPALKGKDAHRCDLHSPTAAACKKVGDANMLWVRERSVSTWQVDLGSCEEILKKQPDALSGCYTIKYNNERLKVMCDMVTKGGGWTLILRDSWKDKTATCAGSKCDILGSKGENTVGRAASSADYVGPHMMGTVPGSVPLRTNMDLLYTISGCDSDDCKMISDQSISFHATTEAAVQNGCFGTMTTVSGAVVWSHAPLHYWRINPGSSCGLSTDVDHADHCWNNMFATARWENLPGGNDHSVVGKDKQRCDQHGKGEFLSNCKKAGDANMLWVRSKQAMSVQLDKGSCEEILAKNSKAESGCYTITYKKKVMNVKCDMTTKGGGWTLILRDSWKDKTAKCGTTCPLLSASAENSVKGPSGTGDYVGPHMMGTIPGTVPLQTSNDLLYTISGSSADNAKIISHQTISFHVSDKAATMKGCYSPLHTISGDAVYSHNPHHFWRWYPSAGCGISTDRDDGGNCWNNLFATSRWENLPGGNDKIATGKTDSHRCDKHAPNAYCKKSGDANMLWVRKSRIARNELSYGSCAEIKKAKPKSLDGCYTITYEKKPRQVQCDMTTVGGGWTLIFRDSWKDKTAYCGTSCPLLAKSAEFSVKGPAGTGDYVGPHMMGVLSSTTMKTTVDLLYSISGCSTTDCMFISHQSISFHSKDEKQLQSGTYDKPLKTVGGHSIYSHHPHHYFRYYPSDSCGISTDRTTGSNCWNNIFAKSRWENLPGGNDKTKFGTDAHRCDQHAPNANCKKSGDANMLWVRPKNWPKNK